MGNVATAILRAPILRARDGGIAVEFALIAPLFVVLLLNVADFSRYIWTRMEIDNAAQTGAHAAYKACAQAALPVTTNCATLTSAVTAAAQSTGLGSGVRLNTGYPGEKYYCLNTAQTLQLVGGYATPPSPFTCQTAGSPGTIPGDYVEVSVRYSFAPLFPGITLVSAETMAGTSMIRLK